MSWLNRNGPLFAVMVLCSALTADEGPSKEADPLNLAADLNLTTRVETRIEVSGELKLLVTVGTEDGGKSRQKTSSVPVEVHAQLRYTDRSLTKSGENVIRHSIRHYELAEAKMTVGKGEILNKWGEEGNLIALQETTDQTDLFAPAGPLKRSELELLTVPCDSGLLNHLLPAKAVQPGDTWEPENALLTRLLRLEVVNQSDVKLTYVRNTKGIAHCTITGKVSGGIDGVTSDLELNGKLNFDPALKTCTWLALDLTEDRAASPGTPGFRTTSRILVAVAPVEVPAELSDTVLAEIKTTPDETTRLLKFVGQPGFELVYEPAWRVVSDQPDLAVLRLIDRGDLVAQCNVSPLKPLGPGEQLTLEAFREGLKKGLGNSFGEFVEAGESLSDSQLRMLRVVIAAKVSEVPIHYVFYHVSDDHQNRLSLAFTMDAEQAERFGRSEETLLSSLRFSEVVPKTEKIPEQASKTGKELK